MIEVFKKTRSQPVVAERGDHLHWLDWVRFLTAFMVVAVHARGNTWVEWGRLAEASHTKPAAVFFTLTRAGTEFVLVFFVLSGLLVGGKVLDRMQAGTFRLRDYAIDRLSRIWLPLLPALAWSAAAAMWVGKPIAWLDLPGNLLGLQCAFSDDFASNGPLWSLGYEIWFYVLAAAVAVWWVGKGTTRIWGIGALLIAFIVFTHTHVVFLFCWVIGALAYPLCRRPSRPGFAATGLVLMGAGFTASQLAAATASLDLSRWTRLTPSPAVATLLLAFGLALSLPYLPHLRPTSKWGSSLNGLGTRLAAFSYTLYLTHYPMLYVWQHVHPVRQASITFASVTWYLGQILTCLVFGWLCYLPFEKQTQKVRQWLRRIWPSTSQPCDKRCLNQGRG